MPLPTPGYLLRSGIQDTTLRYTWDDWHTERAYEPLDDELLARMAGVSYRANIALTVACAEWITYRFGVLSDDPTPAQYAEAAWAAIVDWRYTAYYEPPIPEWSGPIRRPLALAMMMMVDVINRTDQDDMPEIDSASISNLTEHVLTDPTPFRTWRERIVARLESLYPRDEDHPEGPVVPRQALDPDFDFHPDQTPELIRRFLAGISPTANSFLSPPDAMRVMGFHGTPYRYQPKTRDADEA
jgi:hypothetical protein